MAGLKIDMRSPKYKYLSIENICSTISNFLAVISCATYFSSMSYQPTTIDSFI